jgi:hypothetical protein
MVKIPERALFVPLLGQWFDAFACGEKTEEWRKLGPRWNENTCRRGRRVILARGYGWPRLGAVVAGFSLRVPNNAERREFFGVGVLCIVIRLTDIHSVTPADS